MSNKFQVYDSNDAAMYMPTSGGGAAVNSTIPDTMRPPPAAAAPAAPPKNGPVATATDNSQFEAIVRDYVKKNKPKLYILTPCYGSMCYVDYVGCIMQTIELFRSLDFPMQVEFCKNDSLVTRARNNLVARAMTDPDCTHIMFIDSDICWSPVDIIKLILSEKDVCGGIYPLKHYNWAKLLKDPQNPYNTNVVQSLVDKKNASQLAQFITNEQMVQYNMVRYNVNYVSNYLTIENNMTEVRHLATGFMCIRRRVFDKLFKAFPSTKYVDDVCFARPGEEKYSYAIFDTGCEEGHYYSEDWLFCSRWTKLGGKIYADVSINLNHIGPETFQGSYISSII